MSTAFRSLAFHFVYGLVVFDTLSLGYLFLELSACYAIGLHDRGS